MANVGILGSLLDAREGRVDLEHVRKVFGALSFELILREVERRQCPDGGMDGAGVSKMYI